MSENMKKYAELISADEKLREEFKKISELPLDEQEKALTEHAEKLGITLSRSDLDVEQEQNVELSDDDLENVSGGSGIAIGIAIAAVLAVGTLLNVNAE